jgi:hypothetical protein
LIAPQQMGYGRTADVVDRPFHNNDMTKDTVEMFRTIPGAQLCVVPHGGHGVMPKEVVLTFLNELPIGQK